MKDVIDCFTSNELFKIIDTALNLEMNDAYLIEVR